MGSIKLYDYTNNHAVVNLKSAYVLYEPVRTLINGSIIKDVNDNDWTVSVSSSQGTVTVNLQSPIYISSASGFDEVLKSIGLGSVAHYLAADIMTASFPVGTTTLGGDDTGTDYPTISIQKTAIDTTRYLHRLVFAKNVSTSFTVDAYDPAPGSNIYSLLCPISMDTEDPGLYGQYVYGIFKLQSQQYTSSAESIISFKYNTDINATSMESTLSPSKGEDGYVPPRIPGLKPTGGGDVSGTRPIYPSDVITQPDRPDESAASAIGSGFLTAYHINSANLAFLGEALFGGLLEKFANIFVDPLDSIISLQVFPCAPDTGATEYVKLFNYSCKVDKLGTNASAPKLTSQFKQFNFGTLYVPEMFESFLDYDASAFQLYLPFIGTVDIPVGEVMNGYINLKYTVDFFTGMCVANVLCTKSAVLADGGSDTQYAQHSYMGNCSVQIPLHKESYASFVGSLANAASAGLRGGVAGAAGSVFESALNGGFKPDIETKGTINANAGFCAVLYPYITITRPIPCEPDSYQQLMGYPSYITSTLGQCTGLCVCDEIDLTSLAGATDEELNEIKQICKAGIYI